MNTPFSETGWHSLSAGQQELWYWQKQFLRSGAYNEGLVLELDNIDVERLRKAFCLLSMRHPVLRTVYFFRDGAPKALLTDAMPDFKVYEVDAFSTGLQATINDEYNAPFDLAKSVMRVRLYKGPGQKCLMLAVVHHIACDGWSLKILWNELLHCYVNNLYAEPVKPSYADYVNVEAAYLQTERAGQSLEFWKRELEQVSVPSQPLSQPGSAGQAQAAHLVLQLDPARIEQLRAAAHACGGSLFEALLAIYHLSIFYFTREQHILIGTPFFNRLAEFKQVAGYFVNAIGLKNELKAGDSFAGQVGAVHEYLKLARQHSHYPFAAVKQSMPHAALQQFQYFFSVRNRLFDISSAEEELNNKLEFSYRLRDILSKNDSQFDLHLEVYEAKQGAKAVFHYEQSLMTGEAVKQLADRFEWVLQRVAAEPQVSVQELVQLQDDVKSTVMAMGCGPKMDYDTASGYSHLFFKAAQLHGDSIAVRDGNTNLTYAQLAAKALEVSSRLRQEVVAEHPVVAVCLPRSCQLTAIAIGIWQMGGVYMPVDPLLPAGRIKYMLEDAGASVLISEDGIRQLGNASLPAANYDGAYLLYTSGSTGRPKGVLVNAAGMLNHMHSKVADLGLDAQSVVAQTAPVIFDVSVWQMFACLLAGGQVRIYSKDEILNIKHHQQQLSEDGITVMQMVPSYLREFVTEAERSGTSLASLKYLVSAGEELVGALASRWFNCFEACAIANCYGPTEASDNISIHIFSKADAGQMVPAGRALHNMQLYVVDAFGNLCQPGITGEIWVSGAGVAAGYIGNAAERSGEVFMEDPFIAGRWLYKTGDLGKWSTDGLLHFCGRKDRQVKLRGQRIELAEIENVLQQFEAVKQSAVVCDGASIAAYIVWKETAQPNKLEAWLREHLPAYMIPAQVVEMNSMPLTASGKIDRKQLPAMVSSAQEIAVPATELEASLLRIWKQVLQTESIGIHHNFFEHGGHSLKAVQLVAQVEQEHAVELPVSMLLQHPTVALLSKAVASLTSTSTKIEKAPQLALYPASGQQQLVWSLCQHSQQASVAYNMTGVIHFDQVPDAGLLLQTIHAVVQDQQCLHTNFQHSDGRLYQLVSSHPIEVKLQSCEATAFDSAIREHLATESRFVFDFENDPLVRLKLFVSSTGAAALAGAIHHIVADGLSLQLLLAAIKTAYAGGNYTRPSLDYKDYCWWQQQWLQSADAAEAGAYLLSVVKDAEPLHLPIDKERPLAKAYEAKFAALTLQGEAFDTLVQNARALQLPLAVPVIATVQLLLEAFTGQQSLATGIVLNGRHSAHWGGQVGLFMNTLPLVVAISGDDSFEKIVRRVDAELSKLQQYQAFPYHALLQQQPELAPLLSKVLINYMRAYDLAYMQAATAPSSKAELEFECYEISGAFSCRLIYDASLFSDGTAEQLLHCFQTLLTQCLGNPALLVRELQLMSPAAQQQLLLSSRGAQKDYPVHASYAALFSKSARKYAAAIAVSDAEDALTYGALDDLSSRIAARLQQQLQPQGIVAACITRNRYLPALVIGIWKAGCIYLPLDPLHPAERNTYILENANAALFIHETHAVAPAGNTPAITVKELLHAADAAPALVAHKEDWLSYVIYTSGSTGKPKGVMVEQRGMLNHLFSRVDRFGLDTRSKLAQIASHTFDISMWQFFAPLLAGGQVQVFETAQVRNPHALVKLIRAKRITHMQVVPTYLNELLEVLQTTGKAVDYPALKVVATIGEELKKPVAEKWLRRVPGARLFNTYGPTEASDTITDFEVQDFTNLKIPIGKPVDNLGIYVLDNHARLCPPVIPGEICVGGIGVGQGYIGLPEKTAAAFSADPFGGAYRMYRTGDAGRWLPNGLLEFMGRKDLQVKLFGNRIELSEIEQVLLTAGGVKQAAVLVQELAGNPMLVAYFVTTDASLTINDLRQYLRQLLPVYMVPARFVQLSEMPLTSSGKIDRKRLPKPEAENTSYEAPRNKKEEALCTLWEQVLNRKSIGRQDNFFALGGHSLKATELLLRIQRQFGCKLDMGVVFSHPTIALLSELVKENGGEAFSCIPKLPDASSYAVSPSQKRIWVLSQLNGGNTAYNISGNWRLQDDINLEHLKHALQLAVQKHESLRTGFLLRKEELLQVVAHDLPLHQFFDQVQSASAAQTDALIAETCNHPFDLEQCGLLRVRLIAGESGYVLACTLHHIIADGWSVHKLLQEISEAYALLNSGGSPGQQLLSIQYRDYAAWLNAQLNSEQLLAPGNYWAAVAAKAEPLQLVTDHARPAIQSFDGACIEFNIQEKKLQQLRSFNQQHNMSMYMLLVSAVKLLLFRHSNQQNITVGGAVAGREHPATQEMIGCFINTVLLSSSIHPQSLVLDYLQSVRDTMLSAYAHQAFPFDRLVDEQGGRDLSRNALFDVLVNHQYIDNLPALYREPVYKAGRSAKLDLEFTFYEHNNLLQVELTYNTSLFEKQTAVTYAEQLIKLLDELLESTGSTTLRGLLSSISLQEAALLLLGKGAEKNYPVHEGYSNLFFRTAALHGEKIALKDSNKSLSYVQLAARALALSSNLKPEVHGLHPVIAVCMERSCNLAAVAIGIWQMGGIYMPVEPSLPAERIRYMLEDAGAALVIGDEDIPGLSIKQLRPAALLSGDGNYSLNPGNKYNGAYLLYTSGSTGRPKGVLVSAAGMLNHLHSKVDDLALNEQSIVAQTASTSFDVSVWQLFACLLAGGSVRIYSKDEVLNVKHHHKQLCDDGVTVVQMVPAYIREFLDQPGSERIPSLQHMLSVGEELDASLARECFDHFGCALLNAYGPTEAADNISMHFIKNIAADKIPIGRAVHNMQLYVVDASGQLCQPGIAGEIWVSGIGVSEGYIGNARERSAEVFMQDPFIKGRWLYKTGDLGKWSKDGLLLFCGRKDRQVKLRGQRIELAEIENVLQQFEAVRQSAVVFDGTNIAAYLVWKKDAQLEGLQAVLREKLPAYMIPAHFAALESMPLTASGKLDRKRLPAVAAVPDAIAAPANELEASLLKIWKQVLQKEDIGVQHNFFDHGGHSLRAIKLIGAIEEELKATVSLQDVFTHPTIQMQASLLQPVRHAVIPTAAEAVYYPLSSAQHRMWVISQLEKGAGYNICGALQLTGELNIPLWEAAWNQLLQRHEILRTVYSMRQGRPHQQVVAADERWGMQHVHGRTDIETIYREHEQTVFDLVHGPVVRATLVHVAPGNYFFVFALHHIAADEWSLGLLHSELLKLYEQLPLVPLPLQYRDYAVWESRLDYAQHAGRQYWLNALPAEIPVLELPTDYVRPAVKSYTGAACTITIEGVGAQLQQLCKAANATRFMALAASVHLLLFRYCHQQEIITGIPVSGRDNHQLQHSAGLFLNTLPVSSRITATGSYTDVLCQMRDTIMQAFAHKDYPFDKLVEDLSLKPDLSRAALFDVSIVMHEQEFEPYTTQALSVKPYQGTVNASKFDLSFQFRLQDNHLQLELVYNTDLFEQGRIQLVLEHYRELLLTALVNPQQAVGQLNYVPVHEREQLLRSNNRPVSTEQDICTRFAMLANAVGDSKAVADVHHSFSFAALHSCSGKLAHHLKEQYAVQPGQVVAVRMNAGVEMVVALLAILKAGAAYLPLDKSFPQQRIDYILQDSEATLILADEDYPTTVPVYNPASRLLNGAEEHGESLRTAGSIAYIIYTSGTTGKPKGVRITDASLLHYVAGIHDAYRLDRYPQLRGLLASSIAFDLGYTCLWGMLLLGGELHLSPASTYWDPRQVLHQVEKEKINFIKLTPSHFRLLLNEVEQGEKGGEQLSLIVLGGEKINPAEVRQWLTHFPLCRIANHYGPTETTIGVLTQPISLDGKEAGEMSIAAFERRPVLGRAMGAHKIYIADGGGKLCGRGVWGELWISGPGVSPGYVNLAELTAEKFVADPFIFGQRAYRTGDKARWLPNGCIEFAGRADEQVQLKGYRIEPAEVEQALLKHESVRAAAVAIHTIGTEQQLVAYIVHNEQYREEALTLHLRQLLPAYMQPWKLVAMEALPLTPNGKIDKKKLPVPEATASEKSGRAPATRAELALLQAFETVFKVSGASITTQFFDAGGDSIKAIQLSSQLYHNGWELEVRTVFQHPVLEEMAQHMRTLSEEHPFIHAPLSEHYEVSAAQRRLWFINQLEDNPTVYNMLSALAIEGNFSDAAFATAVRQLVQRHEILRTVFITVNNSPRQKIITYDEALHGYELVDLSAKENSNALLEEIFRADGHVPFDLTHGPLFRLKLVRMRPGLHIFVMNLHHIIYDGWSKTVLEEEFLQLFTNLLREPSFKLPQPVYQYKDYAAWQAMYFAGNAANAQRDYWLEQLKGELPILQFPADRPRPAVKSYSSRKLSITFPNEVTERLHRIAGEESTTDFTVLFAAIQVLLRRYSGQDDIITGIPSAGRSRPEVNRMAGLFFNLLPIRTRFAQTESFTSIIGKLKLRMADAYQHGDYPFDYLVEQLRLQRDLSRSALFDVLVVSQDFGMAPTIVNAESGFAVKEVETGFSGNKFDLTFYFRKEEKGLSMTIGYNATIFDHERISLLARHFMNLLESLLEQPGRDILSFNYLTRQEAEVMRAGFNNTIRPYSNTKLLHQLFEEAVVKYPNAEALRHRGETVSYEGLNSSANIIARILQAKGVTNGCNVGILTGRNFSMIRGMLGILKAGAAYVPIDPAYPADRQRYIITNSGIHFIVTDNVTVATNAITGLDGIKIINLDEEQDTVTDDSNLVLHKSPEDLAYTIYTSGSSGRPKGVMIEHHSAVNLVEWVNNEFSIDENDRMLFITSMCFDLSVYDIFGLLAAGGCIVIASVDDVQDLDSVRRLLLQERISFWDTVPTTLNYLVTELDHSRQPFVQHHLRIAFLSGDWIPVTLPALAKKFFPNVRVISLGGATEGTVWSNYFPVDKPDPAWTSIPYGKPITNNFFYILDEALNPVPQGVVGELFIGGVGVSRGYINDEVKTTAAFMDDPFCKDLGGRMYRTGDLGRMLPDGNMEFLGRKDFQVKIRGFRVELGEIEQVLSRFPGIHTVLVNASQDANGIKFLVAYYLGEDVFGKASLTAFLSKHLPDYMIPAFFIKMEEFPLNSNGKIDRKALPQPLAAEDEDTARLLPRTPTEEAVAGIWSNVLKNDVLGVQDNFFMLGGHSLSASQVVARIRDELNVPLKLPSIFINPTIEGLANEIDALKYVREQTAEPAITAKKIIV
jgi:tyrocidine synthetase III